MLTKVILDLSCSWREQSSSSGESSWYSRSCVSLTRILQRRSPSTPSVSLQLVCPGPGSCCRTRWGKKAKLHWCDQYYYILLKISQSHDNITWLADTATYNRSSGTLHSGSHPQHSKHTPTRQFKLGSSRGWGSTGTALQLRLLST